MADNFDWQALKFKKGDRVIATRDITNAGGQKVPKGTFGYIMIFPDMPLLNATDIVVEFQNDVKVVMSQKATNIAVDWT